jgi:hypothetical protein
MIEDLLDATAKRGRHWPNGKASRHGAATLERRAAADAKASHYTARIVRTITVELVQHGHIEKTLSDDATT